MKCPNCTVEMNPVSFGAIAVDHCDQCGGTFFDQNEINRITYSDAQALAKIKLNDSITGSEKACPKDRTILIALKRESVPQHVVLLECPFCRGIFAFGDDLIEFKKAQNAKMHYFTSWRIPMPSLSGVLVFSFVLALSVSVVYRFSPYFNQPARTVKAEDDVCPLQLIDTPSSTVIICKSSRPYTSEAVFYNSQTGEKFSRPVNSTEGLVHSLTVSKNDITPSADDCVQFILTDANGTRTTPCEPLMK